MGTPVEHSVLYDWYCMYLFTVVCVNVPTNVLLIFHRLQSEKAHALDMLHESMRQKDHHHHSDLQTLLGEIQAMRADVCICVHCSIITLTVIRQSV